MTERQYRQMLANRSGSLLRLFETAAAAGLMRDAARSVRRRTAAQEAWRRAAPEELQERCRIVAVDDDSVTIETDDRAVAERIRRAAAKLTREIAQQAPGVRRLRIVATGRDEEAAGERTAPDDSRAERNSGWEPRRGGRARTRGDVSDE